MTEQQIAALGQALAVFLQVFAGCFIQQRTLESFVRYCRGLLAGLERKSIEPIALAAGALPRAMQVFMQRGHIDHARMTDLLQQRVGRRHAGTPGDPDAIGMVGLIDETSHPKKGKKTPGVHRQWCGRLGKVDNCVVTVHLGCVRDRFMCLLDSALFLPEEWSDDRPRCRAAHIPDELVHRPKWRIALDQVRRAAGNGVRFDWLTFDEGYGRVPEFLFELDALGQRYVAEVPMNFRVFSKRPKCRSQQAPFAAKEAHNIARNSAAFRCAEYETIEVRRQSLAPQTWRVRKARVYLSCNRQPTDRTYWLMHAYNRSTDEHKYFISNAGDDATSERLMAVAFRRAVVEQLFAIAKGEVGLSHYECRSYTSLMRHMTFCMVCLLFLAEHTERLRSFSPSGDAAADRPVPAAAVQRVA